MLLTRGLRNRQRLIAERRSRRSAEAFEQPCLSAVGGYVFRPQPPALTTDEQSKLKQELAATRDRQATAAKTSNNGK